MIWFDKNHKDTLYVDCRTVDNEIIYKSKNGKIERRLTIAPDVVADFTDLPFENELFDLVVFDPPHLKQIGSNAWMAKKYGKLPTNWKDIIRDGFAECMRVLSNRGTLIFKWNEYQICVRHANAKCSKEDTFKFEYGSKLAFKRMWGDPDA